MADPEKKLCGGLKVAQKPKGMQHRGRSAKLDHDYFAEQFAREYCVDLCGRRAYQRATEFFGRKLSLASSDLGASKMLGNPAVRALIQKEMDERAKRTMITEDRVLQEIALVAFSDASELMTADGKLRSPSELDPVLRRALSSFEVTTRTRPGGKKGGVAVEHIAKVKLWDKMAALEKLGRHLKLFTDRVEHTGKDGAPLVPEMSDLELARRIAWILDSVVNPHEAGGEQAPQAIQQQAGD